MSHSSYDNLLKKDFWSSIRLWIVMEFLSFGLFPVLGLIHMDNDRFQSYFIMSFPLGIGGAFLVAGSSRFLQRTTANLDRSSERDIALTLAQIVGWVGAFGVMFPFFIVVGQFLTEAFGELYREPKK
ncbi:MAG: hypothetical protein SFW36_10485 [Leptolyngbyaceae cyanobacterium bins.59]|nr:hypothetical protein [Leptolyngbyaceae cyanobacterium bins.59]